MILSTSVCPFVFSGSFDSSFALGFPFMFLGFAPFGAVLSSIDKLSGEDSGDLVSPISLSCITASSSLLCPFGCPFVSLRMAAMIAERGQCGVRVNNIGIGFASGIRSCVDEWCRVSVEIDRFFQLKRQVDVDMITDLQRCQKIFFLKKAFKKGIAAAPSFQGIFTMSQWLRAYVVIW